ncbi:hypothetical protein J5N97_015629 [Dioscorea zingiberensis]|uniref:Uncharacterized protein n=1 Tax=Dioscorea zingiberensis TaxID=325984 RepID=A0A9D5CIS3_9LILI|nr:hypothetical protein J5N97_015629 [Dioscorea zingiberensis]
MISSFHSQPSKTPFLGLHSPLFLFFSPLPLSSLPSSSPAMNNSIGNPAEIQRPHPPSPFGNAFYGTGSGIIRGGLGAYGERFLGSSSEFMQSNVVNGQYVRNKLKVILFPFLHRGHWTRITEPVGGRLSYKPPVHDINAPDLYIPFMAFGTYIVLIGFMLGVLGRFTPEALSLQFTKGLAGWFFQILLLKGLLYSLGSSEAPLLDVVAYTGYAFTGMSVAVFARIFWTYSYYFLLPWICVCMGIFLVKTMKRVLLGGTRSYEKHTNRHHYLLLFMAAAQFPWFFWLGNVSA